MLAVLFSHLEAIKVAKQDAHTSATSDALDSTYTAPPMFEISDPVSRKHFNVSLCGPVTVKCRRLAAAVTVVKLVHPVTEKSPLNATASITLICCFIQFFSIRR